MNAASSATFCYSRIALPGRDWRDRWSDRSGAPDGRPWPGGLQVWGVFQGLFGIASNELMAMTWSPEDSAVPAFDTEAVTVLDQLALQATVRPQLPPPALPCEGLYVFRFFDVDGSNVEEVVRLSREAWETFEDTADYAARPCGLFAPRKTGRTRGRMLLLTWYDGFGSWAKSRAPARAARTNFLRRHALTHGTVAYAAALVAPD
jgi:hypothetical protein